MTGGLTKQQWRQILGIIAKHSNIREIVLYGSRAMGNFREGSDIDLALTGDKITSHQLTQISLDYENIFFPWKLDMAIYEEIKNQELLDHIRRVGVTLKP